MLPLAAAIVSFVKNPSFVFFIYVGSPTACGLAAVVLFPDGYLLEELVVPGLAETADEGLAEVLVEGDAALAAFGDGTPADVPTVVVDGDELAEVVDTDGIEMAGDGLLPVDLAFAIGFLDGTEGHAVGAPMDVGALAVVDEGGAGLAGVVEGGDAFGFDDLYAFGGHIGLDVGKDALEDGDLFFEEGGAAVAFDAALAFAAGEVAVEAALGDIFGNNGVVYY